MLPELLDNPISNITDRSEIVEEMDHIINLFVEKSTQP